MQAADGHLVLVGPAAADFSLRGAKVNGIRSTSSRTCMGLPPPATPAPGSGNGNGAAGTTNGHTDGAATETKTETKSESKKVASTSSGDKSA